MDMLRKLWGLIGLIMLLCITVSANNVTIKGEVKVQAKDASTALLTFPLSWENSWRTGENWDAIWIFAKYKRKGVNEPWHHLYLKDGGEFRVRGADNIPAMEFLPQYTTDYWPLRFDTLFLGNAVRNTTGVTKKVIPGVFMFRKKVGSGDINIPRVSLEWNFKEGDMNLYYDVTLEDIRQGKIEVSVQAIEMIYVPVGPYCLGDRTSPYSFVNQNVDQGIRIDSDEERILYAGGEVIDGTNYEQQYKIPGTYPMGYTGFYTMKYEVSQEQYVNFLNRLTLRDQKKRIGRSFDNLEVGDYVFGEGGNVKDPSYRNGIVLLEKYTAIDTPAVFGFNLSPVSPQNFPDDGKDVACNFLSPDDMLAYLDWIGLRPHSETEFEKSCRERNPQILSGDDSWAWGLTLPNALQWPMDVANAGEDNEQVVNNKNVNGALPAPYPSPVRVGAFATAATSTKEQTGASCWGIMELSGNLAEITYNVDSCGSLFRGDIFGDGNIWSTVCTWNEDSILTIEKQVGLGFSMPRDSSLVSFTHEIHYPVMSKRGKMMVVEIRHNAYWKDCKFERYVLKWDSNAQAWYNVAKIISTTLKVPFPFISWPAEKDAFALRGGSFNDEYEEELAVSYRGKAEHYAARESATRLRYAGFRGGRSVPLRSISTGLIAGENRKDRDTAVICPAQSYTIAEIVEGDDDPMSTVFEWEINDGSGWKKVDEDHRYSKDLVIDWTLNDSVRWHEYKFRRKSVASHAESYGNEVTLCVPGFMVSGERGLKIDSENTFANLVIDLGTTVNNVYVWWKYANNAEQPIPIGQHEGTITLPLNRTDFEPFIDFGHNGIIDIKISILLDGGCQFDYNRTLTIEPYNYTEPAETIHDADGHPYQTKQMADSRLWMTSDLIYNVAAGNNGGYSWPAANNGNYTIQHIIAANAGKLTLCPEHYEIPMMDGFSYLLGYYDIPDPSTGWNSFDPNSGVLYDPGLSDFINDFFSVTSGSAGWTDTNLGFWTSDFNAYGFGADDFDGSLIFAPSALVDGSGNADLNVTFKIRCVKKR